MATTKTVVYVCEACGTEVTVNSAGIPNLSPLYCCGIPLRGKKSKAVKKPKMPMKKTAVKNPVRTAAPKKADKLTTRKPAKKVAAKASKKK